MRAMSPLFQMHRKHARLVAHMCTPVREPRQRPGHRRALQSTAHQHHGPRVLLLRIHWIVRILRLWPKLSALHATGLMQTRYYNGTTTIHIEPKEVDDETECDTFTGGKDVDIVYENSMLGIVEPNHCYKNPHDFEFILTYYDKTTNITPTNLGSGNSPVNDVETIQSVSNLQCYGTPSNTAPFWNFNSTLISDVSYSFSGYRNNSQKAGGVLPFSFNYSSCHSSDMTLWGGSILGPDTKYEGFKSVRNPTITGRFDNNSASLEISGLGVAYTAKLGREDESVLAGPVTITFTGQIDRNRSDDMVPSHNDTPRWNHTLGYVRELFKSQGSRSVAGVNSWVYGFGLLGLFVYFL